VKPLDVIEAHREAAAFLHERTHDGEEIFLSTDQAALYVGSPNRSAFRKWAQRAGLVPCRRGRRLVFSKLDLRAELYRQTLTRRRV
jgi:hypothetical protein